MMVLIKFNLRNGQFTVTVSFKRYIPVTDY